MAVVRRALGSVESQTPHIGVAAARETETTFAELYDVHFSFAWRNARRLGTPDADMDDVLQEVFVVAYRRLREFEGRSSHKTWLFGILVNVVRAHRRTGQVKHPHAFRGECREELETLADSADGPDECAARSEAARVLQGLLDHLDQHRREVFVLAELEQMTAPEIASALGIPLNTVYSRLRSARQEFASAAARHRARDQAEDAWRRR